MSSSDNAKAAQFPPLQISDLLVLTLCVSFALALIAPGLRDVIALPEADLRVARWRLLLPDVVEYVAFGIAFFGLIVLARQRIRGSHCPLSPGHWLLIATGPFAFLRLVTGAWREILSAYWFTNAPTLFQSLDEMLFGLTFVASFIVTRRGLQTLEPRWRVFLILILAWLLVGCAWCALEVAQSRGRLRRELIVAWEMAWLSALAAACVAITIDLRNGIRRDWLHYCAIAMLALLALSNSIHHGALTFRWWQSLLNNILNF